MILALLDLKPCRNDMISLARIVAVLLALALIDARPAIAFDDTVQVPSRTLSDEDFLRGTTNATTEIMLSGSLSGPDGSDKLPVVILLHGTDGPGSGAVWAWSRYLNSIGIASLSLDSYTARGLKTASTDQSLFGQFTQIYDTFRAVDVLATHPKIDTNRIAVMGFSRGGNAALYSVLARFQTAWGPKKARIVAHLPFYPACNFMLVGETEVTTAPIPEFHGSDDDWTPAAPCRDYIGRLAAAGHDAKMTEYPGALHGFDSPRNPARFSDPDAQTSRNCMRKEVARKLVNAATGRPFSYLDSCVQYGPSAQYNDASATASQEAVKAFLRALFWGL